MIGLPGAWVNANGLPFGAVRNYGGRGTAGEGLFERHRARRRFRRLWLRRSGRWLVRLHGRPGDARRRNIDWLARLSDCFLLFARLRGPEESRQSFLLGAIAFVSCGPATELFSPFGPACASSSHCGELPLP